MAETRKTREPCYESVLDSNIKNTQKRPFVIRDDKNIGIFAGS